MRTLAPWLAVPVLSLFVASLAGCPTGNEKPPREIAPPEDAWSSLGQSPEWLVATFGEPADHARECKRTLAWIQGDEGCKGAACEHALTLGREWLKRCPKLSPDDEPKVKALVDAMEPRASASASACAERAEKLLKGGCGGDICLTAAQQWATRCGKSEGSPLTVRFLERLAERQQNGGERVELDVRSCDELGAEVKKATGCGDQFVCADGYKRFEFMKTRCVDEDLRPTIGVAASALLLAAAGQRKDVHVVSARPVAMAAGEAPVVLADGSGAVLTVCGDRATSLEAYRKARAACTGGEIVYARAFKASQGVEVRLGALAFPDDARFTARFPTLVAMGEVDADDKQALAVLASAIASASGTSASTIRDVHAAFDRAHAALGRPGAAAALADRDRSLVPLFTALGRAKRAASAGTAEAGGVLVRGRSRPFADVNEKGVVKAGATSLAGRLDLRRVLPRAMGAYLDALDPSGNASPRRADARTLARAQATAQERLSACADAEKKLHRAKATIVSCGFGLETCAGDKLQALAGDMDGALQEASLAWDTFDTLRTGAAGEDAASLKAAADAAGCREPWW